MNFASTRIPFTPKHQFALSADYERPLSDKLAGFVGMALNYWSDTIATPGRNINPSTVIASSTDTVYGIDSYVLVDGQIGVKDRDNRWSAFLWGKNISNECYWTNVVSGYDAVSRLAGMAATYGVTVTYNLK